METLQVYTLLFNRFENKSLYFVLYTDPIYVFGSSNQGSDQTARMTQLYQAVNSVESENVIYVQGEAGDEGLNDESGDAEVHGT